MNLYRFLPDSKAVNSYAYPGVRVLRASPSIFGSKRNIRLYKQWLDWLQSLNSVIGWKYLVTPKAGYFQTGFPIEQIEGSFNSLATVPEIVQGLGGTFARVDCLDFYAGPPTTALKDLLVSGYVQHYVVERPDGSIVATPPEQATGQPVYTALISDRPMYVNMKYLLDTNTQPAPSPTPPPAAGVRTFAGGLGTVYHLTADDGTLYHVIQFAISHASYGVSPSTSGGPSSKLMSPLDALVANQYHVCQNGDGFSWDANGLDGTTVGPWYREGVRYFGTDFEAAVYVGKDNVPTLQRPALPWNALGYPKRLLAAGAVLAGLDNATVIPLSMRGWRGDVETIIIVDGDEARHKGMTIQQGAALIARYCDDAILRDSGGSSAAAYLDPDWGPTLVSPVGNDAGQVRKVPTYEGVRLK